ncbi:MAG: HPr family phosphocarrier protein [Alicyclobacillus sp.]|nr:HPr family phosphocarrier protein [Alicyclobacillus sp.]
MEKTIQVQAESGLHARPASLLVREAGQFQSQLTLTKNGKSVDLKSILGVMSLAVSKGDEVTIRAEGVDEAEAVERLAAMCEQFAE